LTTVARPVPRLRRGVAIASVAVVTAALTLLAPYALAFDPLAWLVWGRETTRLELDTTSGPSWKPLPVLFTTPFALAGGAADELWLIVARAGGLLAVAGAYALGARLAGRWAGVAGAAAMALSPWWAFNTALGNSEGLLAAATVWAVVAHVAGHRRAALALITAAALMRPEAWLFLAVYGFWLWPEDRRAVLVVAVLVPLLWFGPDAIGAGGALDASHTARGAASPDSAKNEPIPALAVLVDTGDVLTWPALIAAAIAVAFGGPLARRIGLVAGAWVAIVAAMTTAGYAGNPRYLVAAAALGAVLAGAGAVRAATHLAAAAPRAAGTAPIGATARLRAIAPSAARAAPIGATARLRAIAPSAARAAPRGAPRRHPALPPSAARAAPIGAVVLLVAVLATTAGALREQVSDLGDRARSAAAFDDVIAEAGGADALRRCAPIRTSAFARSLVAWRLDLPMLDLDAPAQPPAVLIRARWFYGAGLEPPRGPGYRTLASHPDWEVAAACAT
jgi:hypothetical protein